MFCAFKCSICRTYLMNSTPAIECEWRTQLNDLSTNSIECTQLHCVVVQAACMRSPLAHILTNGQCFTFVSWKNSIFDGIVAICWPIRGVFVRFSSVSVVFRIRCFQANAHILGELCRGPSLVLRKCSTSLYATTSICVLLSNRFCDMWLI